MKNFYFTILALVVIINPIYSWDEVTHAYMTKIIPELIENQELKSLIENNLDEFIYGCWFTDTYQYTNNRVNGLNPHVISKYGKAFTNYLHKEEVKQQENYEKLVALYLGSLAHLMEDFWYDSNLNKYQKTKSDKFKGDSKHGAFVIKQHGYLNLKVKRYFPTDDLFKMYKEAGMLEEDFDTIEEFKKMYDAWSNQQYLLLRSLKFINFLGGNQMYNQSPWTAGNLKTIKGGMLNSAQVAAKFIEVTWTDLDNKNSPLFLHADYFNFDNKIAVLASGPLQESEYSNVILRNNLNDTIQGKVEQFAHPDKKKGITKYAFSFYPSEKLQKNETYTLTVSGKTNQDPFIFEFKNLARDEKLAKPKSYFSTIGLGVFGLIPMLAIAGLFFGLAGLVKFKWSLKKGNAKMPISHKTFRTIFSLIGVAAVTIGFYLLFTRGAIIIDLAL